MRRYLFLGILFWSGLSYATSDRLLIKRSSRPAMAEGSLEALQPWETPIEGFFLRTHHNVLPASVDDNWVVTFEGLLSKTRKMSIKQLKSMPQVSFHAVLECSGNGRALFSPQVSGIQWKRGAVGNAEWTGAPLKEIFRSLGIKENARYVTVEGYDEPVIASKAKFVRSIPIDLLVASDAILALKMNREPIPLAHGGPVRLVIPNIYGQNWIKWVTRMTFSAEEDSRMYAHKAYRMPTTPVKPGESWDPVKQGRPIDFIKVQTIFTSPAPDEAVGPGHVALRGKAFSGSGSINKVEISLDEGETWTAAKLTPPKDFAWQEFEFEINAVDGKSYTAIARATDAKGNTQPLRQEWNPKGYLYNAADRLEFRTDRQGALFASGKALVTQHCLTCHSIELIDQQSLDQNAWESTIKKMGDYGLVLDHDSVKTMATTLASKKPGTSLFGDGTHRIDLTANPDQLVIRDLPKGNADRGKQLFQTYCSECHGSDGKGKSAPFLKGRSLTEATYWTAVKSGRRTMPAFREILTKNQLADIREWIKK